MKPLIKICGITNITDAEMVVSYFPDYLGFIIHEKSPRHVSFDSISEISDFLRVGFGEGCPKLIGVFVNPDRDTLEKHAPFLEGFQLHGEESPEFLAEIKQAFPQHEVWKAFRIQTKNDIELITQYPETDVILVDAFSKNAHGGTGKRIDEELLHDIQKYTLDSQKLIIAGGVTTENKEIILEISKADGIDLSSSLEKTPGKKSEKKVDEFFLS